MKIYVVSAELSDEQWHAVKAFTNEDKADEYAWQIYNVGSCIDSRVDEINLED